MKAKLTAFFAGFLVLLLAITATGLFVVVAIVGVGGNSSAQAASCTPAPISRGTLSGAVPEPYNSAFTSAAEHAKPKPVAVGLIAGLFTEENFTGIDVNSIPARWAEFLTQHPDPNSGWPTNQFQTMGAFQFIPSTWAAYATDGDGDGKADPQNIADAAASAANYISASGGTADKPPAQWYDAIFAYNHLDSYVRKVLEYADYYARGGQSTSEAQLVSATTPSSCAPSIGGVRSIYVLGDSILFGLQDRLVKAFPPEVTVTPNGLISRGILGATHPNGMEQVAHDAAAIARADVIVIELGTNQQEADFASAVRGMIAALRGINPTARILWVNTSIQWTSVVGTLRNQILSDLSKQLHFSIIDWSSAVAADPSLVNPVDGIHPVSAGQDKLIQLIVQAVGPTGGSSCTSSGQAVTGNLKLLCEAEKFDPYGYHHGGGHGDPQVFMEHFNGALDHNPADQAWFGAQPGGSEPWPAVVDCSGLVIVALWNAYGVKTQFADVDFATAVDQTGRRLYRVIPVSEVQPGDLMGAPGHVVIATAAGGGRHFASHRPDVALADQISEISEPASDFYIAGRYIGPGSSGS